MDNEALRLLAVQEQDAVGMDFVSKPLLEPGERGGRVENALETYLESLRSTGGDQIAALMHGGGSQGVCAALYRTPPFEVSVPALPVSRLSITLTSARGGACIEGEPLRGYESPRYALFLTPAKVPMVFRKDVPSRHVNIYLYAGGIGNAELAASLDASRPLLNLTVPGVRSFVDQLVEELLHPAMLNADAADCMARMLLVRVARHLQSDQLASSTIAEAALSRLRDFVMAHLSQRILVVDMARQVGLSLDRFALAYKEQTGQTPYQYVMAVRLEHATELLRCSKRSLAEVASICGFASQQHLSNVMHRKLGVTPGRYRESQQLATRGQRTG